MRATKLRAVLGKQLGDGKQFGLHLSLEGQKLHLERVM